MRTTEASGFSAEIKQKGDEKEFFFLSLRLFHGNPSAYGLTEMALRKKLYRRSEGNCLSEASCCPEPSIKLFLANLRQALNFCNFCFKAKVRNV